MKKKNRTDPQLLWVVRFKDEYRWKRLGHLLLPQWLTTLPAPSTHTGRPKEHVSTTMDPALALDAPDEQLL